MTRYDQKSGARRGLPRRLFVLAGVFGVLLLFGIVWVRHGYDRNLAPVSSDTRVHYVTVATGASVNQIATQLKTDGLIRSSQTFEWYVNSHNQRDKLQAGTYALSPSMSTPQIALVISTGKVATNLVTILPGQNLEQIRATFIKAGFSPEASDAALSASQYSGSPALADNPPGASLEGFLYPDSYQKNANTDPKTIVSESLAEMQKHLTASIRLGFARQNLSVYQGVTLASIVEKEVAKPADRQQVAQVFLRRLNIGMSLGSDVTAIYSRDFGNSAYDTTQHKGLPPGPIATISDSSLQAVAQPAATDWLFFVSGDDGTTHFSHTLQEHQANISKYCHTLCSISN